MTFASPEFLIFLIAVLAAYWSLPRQGQNVLLVVASAVFYAWWDWRFLGLLYGAAGVDFLAALRIERSRSAPARRAWLLASLGVNLGTLAFFKYANFFAGSATAALAQVGIELQVQVLHVILPLGISFYTFQALSYTIDVYRGRMHAVRDPIQYYGFITFFPQLVAGPIERATHLLDQFRVARRFDAGEAADGMRQMLWGFFKKMVVADNLAPIVNTAYNDVGGASEWALVWATYAFAFQIYCDFSGYTDIAIGCARLMGFRLMRNFAYPYFSQDIREFWRRWHISLSTWFRDYLYIPLGGNRDGWWRTRRNLLIVFLVSGLWHGANWTFVAWGAIHGVLFLVWPSAASSRPVSPEDAPAAGRWWPSPGVAIRMLVTFHLVTFAWIFFRANDLTDAWTVLGKIGAAPGVPFQPPARSMVAYVGLLLVAEWVGRSRPHALHVERLPQPVRWAVYYAVVAVIILKAQLDYTPFIYFQF